MKKYVFSYHGNAEMPSDPAAIEEIMTAWNAWFSELGDAVVDTGHPFGPSQTIAPDGAVTDGNVAQLTGYSIVNADSLEAAVAKAKGCPVLGGGSSLVVSEAIDM